jgi:hypothetical protein
MPHPADRRESAGSEYVMSEGDGVEHEQATIGPGWRMILVTATMALLVAAGFGRIRSSFPCDGIRKLRLGMSRDEVGQLLGDPVRSVPAPGISSPIEFDEIWDYSRPVSLFWLSVDFYQGHLVIADAGIKHLLVDDETVFVISERENRESPRFAIAYCR